VNTRILYQCCEPLLWISVILLGSQTCSHYLLYTNIFFFKPKFQIEMRDTDAKPNSFEECIPFFLMIISKTVRHVEKCIRHIFKSPVPLVQHIFPLNKCVVSYAEAILKIRRPHSGLHANCPECFFSLKWNRDVTLQHVPCWSFWLIKI
jgi:hypothetical protein